MKTKRQSGAEQRTESRTERQKAGEQIGRPAAAVILKTSGRIPSVGQSGTFAPNEFYVNFPCSYKLSEAGAGLGGQGPGQGTSAGLLPRCPFRTDRHVSVRHKSIKPTLQRFYGFTAVLNWSKSDDFEILGGTTCLFKAAGAGSVWPPC